VTKRDFTFERQPVDPANPLPPDQTAPVRGSLKARIDTPTENMWRAVFGLQIPRVLDIRVDASGPIGNRENRDAQLRIVIGRAFPITRE
jgi:hypothetical protein